MPTRSARVLGAGLSLGLTLALLGSAQAQPPARLRPNQVKLSPRDHAHLERQAASFEGQIRGGIILKEAIQSRSNGQLRSGTEIEATFFKDRAGGYDLVDGTSIDAKQAERYGHTPVVDLHFVESNHGAGLRWKKTKDVYDDLANGVEHGGPTEIEVKGVPADGMVDLVMTAGASGHVLQPHWGGRPWSSVEGYGKDDTVHLVHETPDGKQSEVVTTPSRGLVTQEGVRVNLAQKGVHTFYYFRTSPGYERTSLGSEPELRQVKITVK
jgi:hypothetical protein